MKSSAFLLFLNLTHPLIKTSLSQNAHKITQKLTFLKLFGELSKTFDQICFFSGFDAALFSFIATISAVQPFYTHDAYTKSIELILFLHFDVRSLDMLMSIEIDRNRSIAASPRELCD